jgi:hypothetical protein
MTVRCRACPPGVSRGLAAGVVNAAGARSLNLTAGEPVGEERDVGWLMRGVPLPGGCRCAEGGTLDPGSIWGARRPPGAHLIVPAGRCGRPRRNVLMAELWSLDAGRVAGSQPAGEHHTERLGAA